MSLTVLVGWSDGAVPGESLAVRAARAVLAAEGVEEAEVSVTLLGDDAIQALNREHLGRDRPTDVIAFPLWEEGEAVVGDVYIGIDQAERQASEERIPLDEEIVRLVVHGTLHVLGWDHPEDAAERRASPMWKRQEELVRSVMEGDRE